MFGALLAAAAACIVIGLSMAVAVDNGIYRVIGASAAFRSWWAGILVGLTVLGGAALAGLVLWFGNGDPTRQLFPRESASGGGAAGGGSIAA
jgi:integral membrane sensor domain MASE1